MRSSIVAIAALAVGSHAFKDTSPFVLFSSSPLPHGIDTASRPVRASHEIVESATEVLEQCNSDVYLFITAPGVTSSELSSNAPHLRRAISHKGVQGKYTVSEAVELTVSTSNDLAQVAERKCGATKVDKSTMIEALTQKQDGKPIIVSWSYESLAGSMEGRDADVANADAHFYNNFVKDLPVDMKYTVIYSTTPANVVVSDEVAYEPTFDIGVHMDLKRALLTRAEPGPRSNDTRPLFEKYQFLTPGLFMGIIVSLLLLSILSVGISAISGLEVSYGAFEKEMGPATQKKAQ